MIWKLAWDESLVQRGLQREVWIKGENDWDSSNWGVGRRRVEERARARRLGWDKGWRPPSSMRVAWILGRMPGHQDRVRPISVIYTHSVKVSRSVTLSFYKPERPSRRPRGRIYSPLGLDTLAPSCLRISTAKCDLRYAICGAHVL